MDWRISPTKKKTWLHKLCVLISYIQVNSLQTLSASQFLTLKEIVMSGILRKNSWFTVVVGRLGVFCFEVLPKELDLCAWYL